MNHEDHEHNINNQNRSNIKLSSKKSNSTDFLSTNNNCPEQQQTIKIKKIFLNKNPNFFHTSSNSTDISPQKVGFKIPNIPTHTLVHNQTKKNNLFHNSSFDSSTLNSSIIDKTIKNYMQTSLMGMAKSKANSNIRNYAKKNKYKTLSNLFIFKQRRDEKFKYSKFFKKSKESKRITAQKIYKHYLNKSCGDIVKPINNYQQLLDDKTLSMYEKLNKIYGISENFKHSIKELKDNDQLPLKKDFDLQDYQSTLVELINPRISHLNLVSLQTNYRRLNKQVFGTVEPKGRYSMLAEKLQYCVPLYLIKKLKDLDENVINAKAKYYKSFKQFSFVGKENNKKDENIKYVNINKTKKKLPVIKQSSIKSENSKSIKMY